MNEIIVPETGLPLKFPDPKVESAARAREFQQLSSTRRLREMASLAAVGLSMARSSPRRAAIEARWKKQEDEFQQIQAKIFERYGI